MMFLFGGVPDLYYARLNKRARGLRVQHLVKRNAGYPCAKRRCCWFYYKFVLQRTRHGGQFFNSQIPVKLQYTPLRIGFPEDR